ncbi:MAG: hypothetical protein IPH57_03220 [Saprospiraceae bacterium]|nr:hypothetical protein [Saprospiraceae bacterium]
MRDWTVVNDCTGLVVTHTQVIRITDTTIPTFCDPENIEARTKAYICRIRHSSTCNKLFERQL